MDGRDGMKAKLLLLALFSIGGCFCTGCGTVTADSVLTNGTEAMDYECRINNGTISITQYRGAGGAVIIPAVIVDGGVKM